MKGLREVKRSTKGNTFIAVGNVTDHKKIGCPECDTVFLRFNRDGKDSLLIYVTPEEATIIAKLLEIVVFGGGR
jgi:hypothetical protein